MIKYKEVLGSLHVRFECGCHAIVTITTSSSHATSSCSTSLLEIEPCIDHLGKKISIDPLAVLLRCACELNSHSIEELLKSESIGLVNSIEDFVLEVSEGGAK